LAETGKTTAKSSTAATLKSSTFFIVVSFHRVVLNDALLRRASGGIPASFPSFHPAGHPPYLQPNPCWKECKIRTM
jgi:hypothetical protein